MILETLRENSQKMKMSFTREMQIWKKDEYIKSINGQSHILLSSCPSKVYSNLTEDNTSAVEDPSIFKSLSRKRGR